MGVFFFALWPLTVFLKLGPNPILLHQQGVVSLVIGSFAIGFLLTAIPRFTGTASAAVFDILALFILAIGEFFALVGNLPALAALLATSKFIYVVQFIVRRAYHAAQGEMPNKSWVLLAFVAAIVGYGGIALVHIFPQMPNVEFWLTTSKNLCSRGYLSGLFIGIGSRLVPMLTGVKTAPRQVNYIFHPLHPWLALMFFSGLIVEFWLPAIALVLQSVAITVEISYLWRLWQLPTPTCRAISLWISSWLMVVGSMLPLFWPENRQDIFHIVFIGVFLAGTVTVASHVLVMHDNRHKSLLNRFWPMGAVVSFLAVAMVTRVTAKMTGYWEHLAYAGATIFIALLIWGRYFLPWPGKRFGA